MSESGAIADSAVPPQARLQWRRPKAPRTSVPIAQPIAMNASNGASLGRPSTLARHIERVAFQVTHRSIEVRTLWRVDARARKFRVGDRFDVPGNRLTYCSANHE